MRRKREARIVRIPREAILNPRRGALAEGTAQMLRDAAEDCRRHFDRMVAEKRWPFNETEGEDPRPPAEPLDADG